VLSAALLVLKLFHHHYHHLVYHLVYHLVIILLYSYSHS
jgi:hypothetical protein